LVGDAAQSAITYGAHSSIKLFEGLTANNSIRVVAFCQMKKIAADDSILGRTLAYMKSRKWQQMVLQVRESAKRKILFKILKVIVTSM
jgi:hypothetical protein